MPSPLPSADSAATIGSENTRTSNVPHIIDTAACNVRQKVRGRKSKVESATGAGGGRVMVIKTCHQLSGGGNGNGHISSAVGGDGDSHIS